jgi:hypothetical protein
VGVGVDVGVAVGVGVGVGVGVAVGVGVGTIKKVRQCAEDIIEYVPYTCNVLDIVVDVNVKGICLEPKLYTLLKSAGVNKTFTL